MNEKEVLNFTMAMVNHYAQFVEEQTGKPKSQTVDEIKLMAKKISELD